MAKNRCPKTGGWFVRRRCYDTIGLSHRRSCVIVDSSQLFSPSLVVGYLFEVSLLVLRVVRPNPGGGGYFRGPTGVLTVMCRWVRWRAPLGPTEESPSDA